MSVLFLVVAKVLLGGFYCIYMIAVFCLDENTINIYTL